MGFAEFTIGLAEGRTRWLYPFYKKTHLRTLAARSARSHAIGDALEIEEGAGKAGCPKHPQSCARMHTADRRCAGTPGLPCAMVLTAYTALSSEPNSSGLRR
jgi:hypothetical protein